jgi:hypothetical protein
MGSTTISNTVNIIDLPVDVNLVETDYIIVQNDTRTFRLQIQDFIITKDNTTFGQEINDLYDRVAELTTIISDLQTQVDVLKSHH